MSLIELCKKGDLEGVKAALKSGADVNTKDENGCTGLIWAVIKKHNSVVELLLNTPNIDVNWRSEYGDYLYLLLDQEIVDIDGWSALHHAVYTNNNEALKLLLNVPNIDVNSCSAMHTAVYLDRIEALKLLLSHPSLTALTLNKKFSIQYSPLKGVTPVMRAVIENSLEQLALLAADPRVDLETTDMRGRSLDHMARTSR